MRSVLTLGIFKECKIIVTDGPTYFIVYFNSEMYLVKRSPEFVFNTFCIENASNELNELD